MELKRYAIWLPSGSGRLTQGGSYIGEVAPNGSASPSEEQVDARRVVGAAEAPHRGPSRDGSLA